MTISFGKGLTIDIDPKNEKKNRLNTFWVMKEKRIFL